MYDYQRLAAGSVFQFLFSGFCCCAIVNIQWIHANSGVIHGNSLNKTDSAIFIKEVSIDTQIQISIVTVYDIDIIKGVGLLVLLWMWVLSVNWSIVLFFSDFVNILCICSLEWISLWIEILYQNRIVSITNRLYYLMNHGVCCCWTVTVIKRIELNRIESNQIKSNKTNLCVYCCEKNYVCVYWIQQDTQRNVYIFIVVVFAVSSLSSIVFVVYVFLFSCHSFLLLFDFKL